MQLANVYDDQVKRPLLFYGKLNSFKISGRYATRSVNKISSLL